MSHNNFVVVLNLSHFFSDYRHRARVLVNEKIKTIEDLQKKITNTFQVENFALVSQNEFLPSTEDARILRSDDVIWVIPLTGLQNQSLPMNLASPKSTNSKRKCSNTDELDLSTSKKKRHKNKSKDLEKDDTLPKFSENVKYLNSNKKNKNGRNCLEEFHQDVVCIPKSSKKNKKRLNSLGELHEVEECISKSTKKNKNKHVSDVLPTEVVSNYNQGYFEKSATLNESTTEKHVINFKKIENTNGNKSNYFQHTNDYQIIVGNSVSDKVSITKSSPLPTITDEYLKEKKINIVRIDYFSEGIPTENVKEALVPSKTLNGQNYVEKNKEDINSTEENKIKNSSSLEEFKYMPENAQKDIVPPGPKFFFFNSPSYKEQREKAKEYIKQKQKRRNIFKLKDLDEINVFPSNSSSIKINSTNIKDGEQQLNKDSADLKDSEQQFIKDGSLPPGLNFNKDSIAYHTETTHELILSDDSVSKSLTEKPLLPYTSSESKYMNISETSSCTLGTPVTNSGSEHSISGINLINYTNGSMRKQISGVGQLLDSIRKNESCDVSNSTDNTVTDDFVSKRKRHRVRHRKKKSTNYANEEATTFNQNGPAAYPEPLAVDACPKVHIKFSDEETNEFKKDYLHNLVVAEGKGQEKQLIEEKLPTIQVMSGVPNVGNLIGFKVLKISDNSTPEISSYIIGQVKSFSPETNVVSFEITFGIEQFQNPKSRLLLNNNETETISSHQECLWSDIIEPKLIQN